MKILLIAGGWSSEREISLAGAKNIERTLSDLGHKVTFFDLSSSFNSLLPVACQHDFAFINLHGAPGEDGLVQAMLDSIKCPYQGSGPAGSFLALNKAAAKQIFRNANIPTADWQFLPAMPEQDWQPVLDFPIFVKSNTGGSSLRLSRAADLASLHNALVEIFAANECAILEPELKGQELTCAILNEKPLPPVLIQPAQGAYFDFNAKYDANGATEICPAPITKEATEKIQAYALKAHHALGLYGVSRSDFIMAEDGEINILEVNTLPGMTNNSLVPKEAAQIGLDFSQLLQKLIESGLKRKF